MPLVHRLLITVSARAYRILHMSKSVYHCKALHREVDFSLPSNRVVGVLNHLVHRRGKHNMESNAWDRVCLYPPEKPTQHPFVERFNGTYRSGVLDKYIFFYINTTMGLDPGWSYNWQRNFKVWKKGVRFFKIWPLSLLFTHFSGKYHTKYQGDHLNLIPKKNSIHEMYGV